MQELVTRDLSLFSVRSVCRTPASRQISRISIASSSKRYGRVQPMKRAERDPVWRIALDGVKGLMVCHIRNN